MGARISVVLATHNGERYLEALLDSLLAQTLLPHEIVISDDCSSDRTSAILNAFTRHCSVPVVRLLNAPALGFRENFIRASLHASGDWVAFCDQDDIWMPEKLARCAEHFSTPGVTQIAHVSELIDQDGKGLGLFRQGIAATGIRPPLSYDVWRTFYGFSMVFRRDLLHVVPVSSRFVDYVVPSHRIAHDRWVFFLAHALGQTVEIATPLAKYRQHDNNLFGAKKRLRFEPRREVREKNRAYVEASAAMVRILESLPGDVERTFPAFDRELALTVHRTAQAQVEARAAVYGSGRLQGAALLLWNIVSGTYASAENGQLRWRSIARDLLYCVSH
jgi:glycosyltransferase involved in cell wall biosynthesis